VFAAQECTIQINCIYKLKALKCFSFDIIHVANTCTVQQDVKIPKGFHRFINGSNPLFFVCDIQGYSNGATLTANLIDFICNRLRPIQIHIRHCDGRTVLGQDHC